MRTQTAHTASAISAGRCRALGRVVPIAAVAVAIVVSSTHMSAQAVSPKGSRPPPPTPPANAQAEAGRGAGAEAKAQPAVRLVRVSEFRLTGQGDHRLRVEANVRAALADIETCAEFAVPTHAAVGPTFRAYVEFAITTTGAVDWAIGGGVAKPLLNCFTMAAPAFVVDARPKAVERYTAYFVCDNRVPGKGPAVPAVPSPKPAGQGPKGTEVTPTTQTTGDTANVPPSQAAAKSQKSEAGGFWQAVGNAVVNDLREEDKRKHDAARAAANSKIESILAPAPPGASARWLGRPVNSAFAVIRIEGNGGSLFEGPLPEPIPASQATTRVSEITGDTLDAYAASVSFFKFGAGTKSTTTSRKLIYSAQALQILRTAEADDSQPMRQAPPGAKYYVHAIYFGRSYDVYLRVNESEVKSASGGGIFAFLSMTTEQVKSKKDLEFSIESRGLELTTKALFVDSPTKFSETYRNVQDVVDPVPVLVEYRRLAPEVAPPPDNPVIHRLLPK